MIGRLVRALLGGLFLGGFVHVIAVLLVPEMAERDAVGRIQALRAVGTITSLPADGSALPDLDPFFVHAACAFDLADGPVTLSGAMPEDVWTVAVVARAGGIVASIERAAAADNRLDLVVGRPTEVERIRLDRAADAPGTTYAESSSDRGFILLRAFAEDPADRPRIAETLASLQCAPYEDD